MSEEWKVPIVKLNKQQLVVDLGGGHFVDLVDLQNKIRIETSSDDNIRYKDIQSDNYRDEQFEYPDRGIGKIVNDKKAFCHIPFTSTVSRGGRQSKVHRSRRLHRRVTRRTRR